MEDAILIGSGSDGDIHWEADFAILAEIELMIVDFQSADEPLMRSEIETKLNLAPPRKRKTSDHEIETISDLISDFARYDNNLYDSDQPNASMWQDVYVQNRNLDAFKDHMIKLRACLDEIAVERDIKSKLDKITSDLPIRVHVKTASDQPIDITSKLSEITAILEAAEQKLHVVDPFLIDAVSRRVVYLQSHQSYRKATPEDDKIAELLARDHELYRVDERTSDGMAHIPYFAGQMRSREMGWYQELSTLVADDEEALNVAVDLRRRLNLQLLANMD